MERILIFIKHNLTFVWKFIEYVNSMHFLLFYTSKVENVLKEVFQGIIFEPFSFRKIQVADIVQLHTLIKNQKASDIEYFHPHEFDLKSLYNQLKNRAFLMMGAFKDNELVGYFFLRFFMNRKCFVGRLIDKSYRGQGIGLVMNDIMYETAWSMNFRCLSTISKNNIAVMKAHSKNPSAKIIKELQDNYLLVEFVKKK